MMTVIYVVTALVGGLGVGFVARNALAKKRIRESESKQKELILKAKDEALKIKDQARREEEKKRRFLDELESQLRKKDVNLDRRFDDLDRQKKELNSKADEIQKIKQEIQKISIEQKEKLQKIAKLKPSEAKKILLDQIEKEYKDDVIAKIRLEKEKLKEESDKIAKEIISTVISRLASEQTAESTVFSVTLPSDEMKGRIIGREGRNIQSFEKITGTDVLIDDTPDTVTISCFNPVRRYVAKVALEKLISDGRIQPSRIEEVVEKVEKDVNKEIKDAGEQAVYDVGVAGLHPDIVKILGRLKFRTSYGQNVLAHSVEVAQFAGMLAAEIGADVQICKKAGLLHDLGKAVDHEVPGAHHHISMDIVKKYGMSKVVVNAIGAHHDDIEPETVEAILVRAADAISGSRPGSRREAMESYIKRLTELENLANSFEGVEKSYAIQAGREIRVIVRPKEVDDLEALKMSKEVAKKIEKTLQYPGTIKVNVIRETRATEYAK
jgi:ribonuclease Y